MRARPSSGSVARCGLAFAGLVTSSIAWSLIAYPRGSRRCSSEPAAPMERPASSPQATRVVAEVDRPICRLGRIPNGFEPAVGHMGRISVQGLYRGQRDGCQFSKSSHSPGAVVAQNGIHTVRPGQTGRGAGASSKADVAVVHESTEQIVGSAHGYRSLECPSSSALTRRPAGDETYGRAKEYGN